MLLGDTGIPDEGLNFDAVVTEVEREIVVAAVAEQIRGNKMQAPDSST